MSARLDAEAPSTPHVTIDMGGKVEIVNVHGVRLEVVHESPIQVGIAIISGHGFVVVPRETLREVLPALTRYADTGSMVAPGPERRRACPAAGQRA